MASCMLRSHQGTVSSSHPRQVTAQSAHRSSVRTKKTRSRNGSQPAQQTPVVVQGLSTSDELNCTHFDRCSGCSVNQQLHDPPVVSEARQFFASRGFDDFVTVSGPVHGWRCRAKLAVRGKAGDPKIGLFQLGSHDLVAIPDCRAHHPRINQASQLIRQITAALRLQPYQEPKQQQQQQQQRSHEAAQRGSSSGNSTSFSSGHLRYIQLTALPSDPGGRAENDPQAQVQVVLVWSAPDASHPSVSDARRLAAALWAQAGPRQLSPLAALRQQAAAVRTGSSSRGYKVIRAAEPSEQQQQAGQIKSAAVHNRHPSSTTTSPTPLIHSIWLNLQPADDRNVILGSRWQLLQGQEWGWQQFGGVPVAIAPGSFVQANYGAMQRCLSAIAAAVPPDASVVEYYAGCGVIGLSLAAAGVARQVVCVEVNPDSKKAFEVTAAQLAKSNKAAAASVAHHVGSADDIKQLQHLLIDSDASVLVVDPPRKGLDQQLLQLLIANNRSGDFHQSSADHITRLIYLSCGFKALMRDTDALLASGWRLSSCQAFFFFPGTDSIETLAVFDR